MPNLHPRWPLLFPPLCHRLAWRKEPYLLALLLPYTRQTEVQTIAVRRRRQESTRPGHLSRSWNTAPSTPSASPALAAAAAAVAAVAAPAILASAARAQQQEQQEAQQTPAEADAPLDLSPSSITLQGMSSAADAAGSSTDSHSRAASPQAQVPDQAQVQDAADITTPGPAAPAAADVAAALAEGGGGGSADVREQVASWLEDYQKISAELATFDNASDSVSQQEDSDVSCRLG